MNTEPVPMSALLALLCGCPFIPADLHESNDLDDDTGEAPDDDTGSVDDEVYTCVGDRCTLYGPVVGTLELDTTLAWTLSGEVRVGEGDAPGILRVATSEEPVVLRMDEGASLVVRAGSSVQLRGGVSAPVVLTSAQTEGARAAGDWKGIEVLGNAPVSCVGGVQPCVLASDLSGEVFGGDAPEQGGTVLDFVRLEFAGGGGPALALYGAGSDNLVRHVQIHRSGHRGVALRGGTVPVQRLVVTGAPRDGFAWTNGWEGSLQQAIVHNYDGSQGAGVLAREVDPGESATVASPVISGLTVIEAGTVGARVETWANLALYNAIVWLPSSGCLDFQDQTTVNAQQVMVQGTVLYGCGTDGPLLGFAQTPWGGGENNIIGDPLIASYDPLDPDYAPLPGGAAAGRGVAVPELDLTPTDAGAIDGDDWTVGWTAYPEN